MKKLMIAFAVAAMAVAANAARVTWGSGALTDATGGAVTEASVINGYLFQLDKEGYEGWMAKGSTGALLSKAVADAIAAGDLELSKAYATDSNTYSSRGGASLTLSGEDKYSANQHAYALIVYEDTVNAGYYMGNAIDFEFTSPQDSDVTEIANIFGGAESGSTAATAWAQASAVPEPTSGLLLLLGVAGLALRRRRA